MIEVPLSFFWFWDGEYVSQLPYVWYYVVKSSLNMLVSNARAYVFWWSGVYSVMTL